MCRFLNLLDRIAVIATNTLLSIVTVVLFVQVFNRYVLNSTTPWSEVLARYSIVWMTLLGLGLVVRRQEDIRIDIIDIYVLKSRISRIILGLFIKLLEISFMIVLIVSAIRLLPVANRQNISGLGVPLSWVYFSFVVGPVLTLPFLVERAALLINDLVPKQIK